eukprot:scaffold913_cov186-Alexandrium_tamarense.AAC.6
MQALSLSAVAIRRHISIYLRPAGVFQSSLRTTTPLVWFKVADNVRTMPRKYTNYNFFFQLKRTRILQELYHEEPEILRRRRVSVWRRINALILSNTLKPQLLIARLASKNSRK